MLNGGGILTESAYPRQQGFLTSFLSASVRCLQWIYRKFVCIDPSSCKGARKAYTIVFGMGMGLFPASWTIEAPIKTYVIYFGEEFFPKTKVPYETPREVDRRGMHPPFRKGPAPAKGG